MKGRNAPYCLTALLVFIMVACTPTSEGPSTMPLEDLLRNSDSVLAEAFERSGLLSTIRMENYPLTVFFVREEEFTSYLAENGLTEESFLTSDRLGEFMNHFLVRGTNLAQAQAGTYTLVSGDTVETRDVSSVGVTGTAELVVNGQAATCQVHMPEDKDGAICYIGEPLVDFAW